MSQPKSNEGTRKTLYDIADFNDVFPAKFLEEKNAIPEIIISNILSFKN